MVRVVFCIWSLHEKYSGVIGEHATKYPASFNYFIAWMSFSSVSYFGLLMFFRKHDVRGLSDNASLRASE